MKWKMVNKQWELSDDSRPYWDQLKGFVMFFDAWPNVFDAFKANPHGHGKDHGPIELGRFTTLEAAKAAVEQAVAQ